MKSRIEMKKCYRVGLINKYYQCETGGFIYANNVNFARQEALNRYKDEIKGKHKHVLIDPGYMVEIYNINNVCVYIGFQLGGKKEVMEEVNKEIEEFKKIDKQKNLF